MVIRACLVGCAHKQTDFGPVWVLFNRAVDVLDQLDALRGENVVEAWFRAFYSDVEPPVLLRYRLERNHFIGC